MKKHIEEIRKLLNKHNYSNKNEITELPTSGSERIYFRVTFIEKKTSSILAAFNPIVDENIAWYSYTTHFRSLGLSVPEIYARDESYCYFLLEDMGNVSFFDLLKLKSTSEIKEYYKQAVTDLIKFQVTGIKGLDLDVAYPVKSFDRTSILWDLNYFKYYFVKTNNIEFNERELELDFQHLADQLLKPKQDFFLYRDFQTRNILVNQNKLWYIDYQGGRKGPLQYDLVSLLYQAKADLSNEFREDILNFYLMELDKKGPGMTKEFSDYYIFFIYFRLMQVLGAYGFRGIIQRKGHFLDSIPNAIKNLEYLLENKPLNGNFNHLTALFKNIIRFKSIYLSDLDEKVLTVHINSFSFKKNGYPIDRSENGGGFVFDCRALPNPGRVKELRDYTGLEKPIREYFTEKTEMQSFLSNSFNIIDQSIENYLERGFNSLSVNFGCTGGKHRSVYSAERLKDYLKKYKDQVKVHLKHIQIGS